MKGQPSEQPRGQPKGTTKETLEGNAAGHSGSPDMRGDKKGTGADSNFHFCRSVGQQKWLRWLVDLSVVTVSMGEISNVSADRRTVSLTTVAASFSQKEIGWLKWPMSLTASRLCSESDNREVLNAILEFAEASQNFKSQVPAPAPRI